MRVSIIMPAYNRGYIIREAIESALAQSWRDFELVIVDDGSRDNTPKIVDDFCDSRIRYIRHEQNRGYPCACNTGLLQARGELISFLDSDDLWKPEKLERDVRFLETHPEAGAVFTDLEKEGGATRLPSFMRETPYFSKMLANRRFPPEMVFTRREMNLCLRREVPVKPTSLTLRTKAVKRIGFFDVSRPSGSDWDFLLRFSREFRFGYIDESLAILRVQGDATHYEHRIADLIASLEMLKREMDLAAARGDNEAVEAAKWGYCDTSKHLAWSQLHAGQRYSAAKTFLGAFRESREIGMLPRALLACFPRNVRAPLKRVLGRQEN